MNLMSSPGAGKTTTLKRTIAALRDEVKIGVMEADIDGEVDAVIPEYLTDCWKWAVRRTEVMRTRLSYRRARQDMPFLRKRGNLAEAGERVYYQTN